MFSEYHIVVNAQSTLVIVSKPKIAKAIVSIRIRASNPVSDIFSLPEALMLRLITKAMSKESTLSS
jgi:hypothetical protein